MVSKAHEAPRDPIAGRSGGWRLSKARGYGPYPLRVCAEKVADFVTATSDDPDRWKQVAPPGWAAAALFVVAPILLTDPDLGDAGTSVIHGEQRFEWVAPASDRGGSERHRGRSQGSRTRRRLLHDLRVRSDVTRTGPVVKGTSIFLMSGSASPASAGERSEPAGAGCPWQQRCPPRSAVRLSGSCGDRPPGRTCCDMPGATRDWNPIHWDHDSAVAAGLPTMVVHGLLQAAWLLSAASVLSDDPAPIVDARFRFRSPMIAGSEAAVTGDVNGKDASARLAIGDREIVSATMTLR